MKNEVEEKRSLVEISEVRPGAWTLGRERLSGYGRLKVVLANIEFHLPLQADQTAAPTSRTE